MAQLASQMEYREREVSTIANPAPLGLLTLALTTALIGASFARFLVPTVHVGMGMVVGTALVYGGIVQILAGMWEFRKKNTLAATLFSAYGGFLLAFGMLFLPTFGLLTLFGTDIRAFNHAMGLLFLCWTISSAVLFVGALRTNLVLLVVLGCLCLSYLFLALGEFANANGPLLGIGGWLAIICALVAWYAALAGILQSTHSTFQLPLWEKESTPPLTSAERYGGEPSI